MPGVFARRHDGRPLWRETLGRSLGSHDATELVGGMCHGNGCRQEATASTTYLVQRRDGALSLTIGCSTRHWLDPFVRVNVEDTWPFRQRASGQNGRLNPLRIDITKEAGALFDNHPRLKNKALLLDITIVNLCAGSNLGNATRHVGKHLADAVERKINKYRGSFPATHSLLPLAMSTCGDVGSDVHALIKELAIRRVQHWSETYSNESQHLAEGIEGVRLRRRFSFVLQQALSFRTRHYLCRQGVALASTRQPRSQGPASVQAHRAGGVTGPEGQEGANGVGGGIGVGGGNGGGNGDVNCHGDGDGAGTGTGVEVNEGAQDGNGDGSGEGAGTGTGTGMGTRRRTPDGNGDGNGDGSEDSKGDGNRDEDNGNKNEDRIGESEREAKKRKKPQNSCRRRAGNGGDSGRKRKKCRKERVGSVAPNPDNLESNKVPGEVAQGTQGSSTSCKSRESVFPLSRLIRGFRNKYH